MFPEDSQTPAGQPPLDGSSLSRLRDFEKVRERILLRIEPRHVVQLLLAALLLAAAAFVGGYVVAARGYRPEWLGDWLGPRGGQALAHLQVSAGAVLPEPSSGPSPDADGPAAAPGALALAAGVTPAAVAAGQAIGPDDLVAGVPAADPGEQVIAAAVTAVQAPVLAAAEPALPTKAAGVDDPADPAGEPAGSEAVGVEAAAASGPGLAPAGADAAGGDAASAAPPRTPRAGRPNIGKYMVQIKAFRAQVDADAFAEELRGKGYTVAVSAVEVADRGQFFRVRMGPFGTLDAARVAQKKLEQAEGHATIILATP